MEDRRLMTKRANIDARLEELEAMDLEQLRDAWRRQLRTTPPRVSAGLLRLALAHAAQEKALGGLPNATRRRLRETASTGRPLPPILPGRPRSEEPRVGTEWVRTCRARWSTDHKKK